MKITILFYSEPCCIINLTVPQAAALAESEEEHQELQAEGGMMEKTETTLDSVPLSSGGVLPRTSKESTPGASSSKEGKYLLATLKLTWFLFILLATVSDNC